jgi:hypothetical protein
MRIAQALMNAEDADMRTPLQVGVHKPECQSHLRGLLADVSLHMD